MDLLNIDDPNDIGGPAGGIPSDKFNFPLQSVESVTRIDDYSLLVGLDNNYPGGNGRVPGTPDGTEMITLRSTRRSGTFAWLTPQAVSPRSSTLSSSAASWFWPHRPVGPKDYASMTERSIIR